jgi:hypothetical protein
MGTVGTDNDDIIKTFPERFFKGAPHSVAQVSFTLICHGQITAQPGIHITTVTTFETDLHLDTFLDHRVEVGQCVMGQLPVEVCGTLRP